MKKLLAVLLTAAMTLSMLIVPVGVSAETTTKTATVGYQAVTGTKQTGTTDWANVTLEQNGTYFVDSADDMTALATAVNNGSAKGKNITVYVTVDTLDMSGVTFTGIGTATNPFDGTFDGQGVTVKNLAMNLTESQDYGLFGVINGATIKNIVLDSTCTVQVTRRSATLGDGALVGKIADTGIVDNVMVKMAFTFNTNEEAVGGIVGIVAATSADDAVQIKNCTFSGAFNKNGKNINQSGCVLGIASSGKVTLYNCVNKSAFDAGYGYDIGGLIGLASSGANVTIDQCTNEGNITAKFKVGGIVGEACDIVITNSDNIAAIKSIDGDNSTSYCGGIVGIVKGASSVTNTTNSGTVTSNKYNNAGGIAGYVESGTLTLSACRNAGAVNAKTTNAGGMVGYASGKLTLNGCTNNGAIKATTTYAGGMVAQIAGADSSIIGCTNNSTVWVSTGYGSGIVGNASATLTIEDCINTTNGVITCDQYGSGNSNCAGILGYTNKTTTVKNCVNSAKLAGNAKAEAGIVGAAEAPSITIEYCVNNGEINARNGRNVGGILGYTTSTTTKVIGCENTGKVYSNNSMGGIVGYAKGESLEVVSCANFGVVEGKGADTSGTFSSLGGIVGNIETTATVTNCANYGELKFVGAYIGGLAGVVQNGKTATFTNFAQKGIVNAPADGFTAKVVCGNEDTTTGTINATNCYDATSLITHFAGYQLGTYTEEGVTGNKIRLVGTIGADYANYDEVGFIVTIKRGEETKTVEHYCEAIYSSLLAENNNTVAAEKYRNGGYMFALALYGISAGEYTFEVQTVSLAMNGETYTVGETSTFTCTVPAING